MQYIKHDIKFIIETFNDIIKLDIVLSENNKDYKKDNSK